MKHWLSRMAFKIMGALTLAWLLAMPANAHAYALTDGFTCQGPTPQGALFDSGRTCDISTASIFSGLVCQFEQVVSEVFSHLYCAIQDAALDPMKKLLTLFIAIFGVLFLTGMIPFTAKEMLVALIKVALVWAFATQAEYGIGVAYTFFMGAAQEGITWVLSVFKPADATSWQADDAIRNMDTIVFNQMIPGNQVPGGADANNCQRSILALAAMLLIALPPVFLIVAYATIQTLLVFGRAMLGYLTAIAGITFLMTLAPIFLGFALFKVTFHLFEKWLQYMITFALQMVIVFAFIALVEMVSIGDFLSAVLNMIHPYDPLVHYAPIRKLFELCSICEYTWATNPKGLEIPVCLDTDAQEAGTQIKVIPLLQLVEHIEFITLIVTKIIALLILGYAMEAFLRNVPEVAKQLSGPFYAPRVGGMSAANIGTAATAIHMPGTATAQAIKTGMIEGFVSSGGLTPAKLFGAISGAKRALVKAPAQEAMAELAQTVGIYQNREGKTRINPLPVPKDEGENPDEVLKKMHHRSNYSGYLKDKKR